MVRRAPVNTSTSGPEYRRAQFHRFGPIALVVIVGGIALAVSLYRSHKIDRFEVLYFVAIVPTVIFHEVSHGLVAYWCGDDTAKQSGRLSLNPLRHIDPIGSIALPILLLLTSGAAFGYARPVPVMVNRLRHPRNQAVLVSLAGPATNILIAAVAGVISHYWIPRLNLPVDGFGGRFFDPNSAAIIPSFIFVLGLVNVVVAIFNLIPIPPLDGSAVVERFIPASLLPGYYQLRRFAMILIVLLFILDRNGGGLTPLFNWVERTWQGWVL